MGRFIPKETITASVEEIEAKASAPVTEGGVDGKDEGLKFEKPIEAATADKGVDQATETPVHLEKDSSEICEASQVASNKVEAQMRSEQKEGDALITSAENLIELGCSLESLQANNSVDSGAIAMLNASVESILQRLPDECRDFDLPSTETFSTGSESSFVQISVEGIVQGLQKIVAKIVHNFNGRLITFSRSMVERRKVTESLKSKIQTLEGRINDAHREEGEKTVSGDFLKHLFIDGKAPEPATLIGTLKYQADLTKQLFSPTSIEATNSMVANFASAITQDLKKKDLKNPSKWWFVFVYLGSTAGFLPAIAASMWSLNSGLKTVVSNMRDIYGHEIPDVFKILPMVAKNNVDSGDDKVITKATNPLLGNVRIKSSRLKDDVRLTLEDSTGFVPRAKVGGIGFSLSLETTKSESKAGEIRGLTGGEQKQVVALCKALVGAMEDFSASSSSHVKNYTQTSIKATNEIVDAVGGIRTILPGNLLGVNGLVLSIQKIQQGAYGQLIGAQTAYLRHLQTTVNALLAYVDASSTEAKKTKEDE